MKLNSILRIFSYSISFTYVRVKRCFPVVKIYNIPEINHKINERRFEHWNDGSAKNDWTRYSSINKEPQWLAFGLKQSINLTERLLCRCHSSG